MTACLRCGYCCKKAPCVHGEWDTERGQCSFLEGEEPGEYSCGKYAEIEYAPGSPLYPYFGGGCSSPLFNTERNKLRERRKDVAEPAMVEGSTNRT